MKKIKDGEFLEVVDNNDKVVLIETREKIHKEGLRHREVYVWFYNKEGLFLQLRAKDKELYPNMFDSAVSGHVEIGDTYLISALKETLEETGVRIEDFKKFEEIRRNKEDNFDESTGKQNNIFSRTYIYNYTGKIEDLEVEEGKAQGFELVKWQDLNKNSEISKKIIPLLLEDEYLELFRDIEKIAKK